MTKLMTKLTKKFNTDRGGIVSGVFFTLLILTVLTLLILDTVDRTYVYQGETEIITQDAIKLVISWEVEYTWWYFVPKDYKASAEKELDQYCDFMIKEKYQAKYPLIDFLSSGGSVANVLPMKTRTIRQPYLVIDTLYRRGLITINEKDNLHIMKNINEYIDTQLGIN